MWGMGCRLRYTRRSGCYLCTTGTEILYGMIIHAESEAQSKWKSKDMRRIFGEVYCTISLGIHTNSLSVGKEISERLNDIPRLRLRKSVGNLSFKVK